MGLYPMNPRAGQLMQTDAAGVRVDRGFLAHYQVADALATAASTTGIHAAVTDNSAQQVITTGITQPSVTRNVTATAGGTAADIKAVQVIVTGTNMNGDVIIETLPAFTVNTAGSVAGSLAFKTVTSITIPAHDGNEATTAVGFGEVLGLPHKLAHNTVLAAYLDNAKQATAPTVAVSGTVLDANTFDLDSALDSKVVDVYYIV